MPGYPLLERQTEAVTEQEQLFWRAEALEAGWIFPLEPLAPQHEQPLSS